MSAVVVDRSCHFNLKCVDQKRSNTLTVGKTYCVKEIGMNGQLKVFNDNHRYGWYHPSYFNYRRSPAHIKRLICQPSYCLFGAGIN